MWYRLQKKLAQSDPNKNNAFACPYRQPFSSFRKRSQLSAKTKETLTAPATREQRCYQYVGMWCAICNAPVAYLQTLHRKPLAATDPNPNGPPFVWAGTGLLELPHTRLNPSPPGSALRHSANTQQKSRTPAPPLHSGTKTGRERERERWNGRSGNDTIYARDFTTTRRNKQPKQHNKQHHNTRENKQSAKLGTALGGGFFLDENSKNTIPIL